MCHLYPKTQAAVKMNGDSVRKSVADTRLALSIYLFSSTIQKRKIFVIEMFKMQHLVPV